MKLNRSIVCLVLVLVMCLSGCVIEFVPASDADDSTIAPEELTNIAVYDDGQLELLDATTHTSDEGKTLLRVRAVFTNNSQEPLYALSAFAVRAFQDDMEITDLSDINGNEASLIQEVRNGKSVEVYYVFELTSDSEVEVLVGEPTAERKTIGKQTYSNTGA